MSTNYRLSRVLNSKYFNMPTYNIVCKTNGDKIYLWNGTGFDHLNAKGKEFLYYSGKSIKKADLSGEVAKCRLAVKQLFPDNSNAKIEPVEVAVSV